MQNIERLIRRARVKMRMMNGGRVYRPPKNESFDMVVDSIGIRFSTTILSVYDETASVVCLDYADNERRTIDNCLELEKSELC